MLPFLFKDFLLFSGRVESRDNICIIEHHLIDRNHTCVYLAKSHLSTTYVLRDRPPLHHFFTESLGAHALIYLSANQTMKPETYISVCNAIKHDIERWNIGVAFCRRSYDKGSATRKRGGGGRERGRKIHLSGGDIQGENQQYGSTNFFVL